MVTYFLNDCVKNSGSGDCVTAVKAWGCEITHCLNEVKQAKITV